MAPSEPDNQGTGRRAGLDRDEVVDRALQLVEAGGPEALTMRKLAAELGVATTTIYWHVGGRDELINAVIVRLAEQQALVPIDGSTPRERVMSVARRVWESALTHRHVTSLAHQAGSTSLLEMEHEKTMVRELEAAGLRGDAVRDAQRAVLMCVAGFLVVALQSEERVPSEQRSEALWADLVDAGDGDHDFDPASMAALSEPPDLPELLETTLQAVVAAFVPAD